MTNVNVNEQMQQLETMLLALKRTIGQDRDETPTVESNTSENTSEEANTEPFKALFYDRKDILTLSEAASMFGLESQAIYEMPFKPVSGEVYLFKGRNETSANNWRSNGHRWNQANGGRWVFNGLIKRKVSNCVTKESGQRGTNQFQMITWNHKEHPLLTLVQFVGDESVSQDFPHGNAKHTKTNYHRSAPELLRDLEVSTDKPSKVYHQKVSQAPPDVSTHRFKVPRNVSQVRNSQHHFKKKTEGTDSFSKLHLLSLEFEDICFMATIPDLILVVGNPHMIEQAKEILALDYDKCSQKQLLGYDTQFNLGNFVYCQAQPTRAHII